MSRTGFKDGGARTPEVIVQDKHGSGNMPLSWFVHAWLAEGQADEAA